MSYIKGGTVRLPSDSLTPGEVKKMSSSILNFDLDHRMSWEAFKAMPLDLQRSYHKKVRENFHAGNKELAELFGVSTDIVWRYLTKVGIKGKVKWHDADQYKDKFWRFCKGEAMSKICGDSIIEEPNDKDEQPDDEVEEPKKKIPLYDMKDLPKVFGPGTPIQPPDLQLTEKSENIRALRAQLKSAYMMMDEKDELIAQLQQEKTILEAQMQVVWGFLGKEER